MTLECIAFDADITWERRNGEIPNKAILREGNTIMEIPNVRREDADNYRCTAENRVGITMSKYAKVSVTGELDKNIKLVIICQHIAKITKLFLCRGT